MFQYLYCEIVLKFKEQMDCSADQAGNIEIDELILHLPKMLIDVSEQFYREHGRFYIFKSNRMN